MSDLPRQTARPEKIRCDACPVMCYIAEGKVGACDRYANHDGDLVRLDTLTVLENTGQKLVPFAPAAFLLRRQGQNRHGPAHRMRARHRSRGW